MTGYAPGARKAWQRVLAKHRTRISALTTVGANRIVQMGATVMGLMANVAVEHR